MRVSVETTGKLERRVRIEVPAETVESAVDKRLREVGRSARIKGFRPGKIPAKVVRQRYGSEVRREVLEELVRSSLGDALRQEELSPATGPRVETENREPGSDFSFTATFEVYPDIELKQVEGLSVEYPVVEVTETDVDEMLETLRRQNATWQEVERPAADGDRVTIDFRGSVKGEPFEGGEASDYPVVLGEGAMLEDFEKALRGVEAGTVTKAKVKFPKDYGAEALAGKTAEFEITVKKVEEQLLPELDEEFARGFGLDEGGVERLRREVRENMERELSDRVQSKLKEQVLNRLIEANPLDVPEGLVHEEIHSLQHQQAQRLGKSDPHEVPVEPLREPARRRVTLGLLIGELIKHAEIQLDQEMVNQQIARIAGGYQNPDQIARLYQSDQRARSQIEMMVLEEQVVDWLLEKADAAEKPVPFKTFMNG